MNSTKTKSKRNRAKKVTKLGNKPIVQGATSAPVAKQRVVKTNAPKVRTIREGVVVTHREYIQDLSRSNNTFTVDTIAVNAGLASAFPWLSQVAGRFESYTFERLDFVYEPMVPTTQAGSVMMAVDFDAIDTPPANKTTIMSYKGATRSSPWQASKLVCSGIDRLKMVPERYVRTAALVGNYDLKTYDLGNLHIATVGTGTTAISLGEIYVEYTVRLRTPQIQTGSSLVLSRRSAQTGSFQIKPTGEIINHVANLIGDATKPLAMVHPSNSRFWFINTAQRLLMTYWTTWAGITAQRNVSSMFRLGTCNSVPVVEEQNVASTLINRIGRPANMFQQSAGSAFASAPLPVVEQYVVNPDDGSLVNGIQQRGTGPDYQLTFETRNDAITGSSPVTVNYTIIPLDNEGFPIANAGLTTGGIAPNVIDWPNIQASSITPTRVVVDSVNTFNFNIRERIDEHPALSEKRKK